MTSSIHIKLEHPEALEIRRDALLFEENLLKIIGNIRAYDALRKSEFALKNKIKKDIGELKALVSHVESTLPKEEVKSIGEQYKPEKIKREAKQKKEIKEEWASAKKHKMSELEREIEGIRDKLARLG